ncbi:MAG TPA: energy-coupling factor transporter transmembrane protein EcfT [Clostridia bacterium]|nr:energy-coupling factor transporter transmembrane protein EcfT [Clostridia bacterium]
MQMYVAGNSFIHRMDPRAKITVLATILVLIFLVSNPLWLLGVSGVSVAIFLISGLSYQQFRPLIRMVMVLAVIMLILQGFSWPGERALFWLFGRFDFTLEGTLVGLSVALRLFNLLFAAPALMVTTPPERLILGLNMLKIPYKYCFVIAGTLTFFPILQATSDEINAAQKSRAFDLLERRGFVSKLQGFFPQLLPLILLSLRKAYNLQIAIESRALGRVFRKGTRRTYLVEMKMTGMDYAVVFLCLVACLVTIVFRIMGYGTL